MSCHVMLLHLCIGLGVETSSNLSNIHCVCMVVVLLTNPACVLVAQRCRELGAASPQTTVMTRSNL